jgi:hypothetical protein
VIASVTQRKGANNAAAAGDRSAHAPSASHSRSVMAPAETHAIYATLASMCRTVCPEKLLEPQVNSVHLSYNTMRWDVAGSARGLTQGTAMACAPKNWHRTPIVCSSPCKHSHECERSCCFTITNKQTPWPLVRERTIPTEWPPLVGET